MNVTTSSSAHIYVHTNKLPTPHYNTPTPHPIPATLTMALFLPMLGLLLLLSGVHGQSSAASPGPASAGTDCQTALLSLADCLSYVEAGSNVTKPDKACCPELSGLVNNSPQCLCPLLGSSGEVMGLPIDKKKALQLPSVCHVTTPPVSLCSLFGVPVASPTLAPTSGEAPTALSVEAPTSADGQSPVSSPDPASAGIDCQTELLSLADCLSYVSAGSNVTKPDKACCPELSKLVNNTPQCLCPLLGSSGEVMGMPIDKKKAMQLPSVCHVTTPPVSLCSLFGVPVASPTLAPTSGEAPTSADGGLDIPSSTGSTPSLAPSTNRGNKGFRGCNALLFIALFFTIFSSLF